MLEQARTLRVTSAALPTHLGQPALVPVRLSGDEGLNRLFAYELELKSREDAPPSADVRLEDLSGRELTVGIELEGKGAFIAGATGPSGTANVGAGTRELSGLIAEAAYLHPEGRRHLYRLTLRPWLWLATLTTDCKIFQDKNVIEVLDVVFADYPYPVDKRLAAERYPARDFTVQFNESDYDFFARLCEEWGIAWWFEHADGKHRLVLADGPGAFQPNPSEAYRTIDYYPPGFKPDREYVDTLDWRERLTTGATASSDRDYTRTRADLTVDDHEEHPTSLVDQEEFRWPIDSAQPKAGVGGIEGEANDAVGEGRLLNSRRLEALRQPALTARGRGNLRAMVVGCTFTLAKHPREAANRDWLIVATRLEIEDVGEESQRGEADDNVPGQTWHCRVDLELQFADRPYRAPLTTPRPKSGIQRAVVTGPADKEMWTDRLGRVKVAFPWDRYHEGDERSSAWLRVSSPWAGTQYGGIQIPRVGQEVLVAFESGDIDRPLLVGRVVNDSQMPPWALPDNHALAGFRSKELYGHQANHLVLDDSEGEVQAQLSSDHALSQLNLGKIVRIPDERGRKDRRGEGFELRTDAHGVIRAQDGLLVTSEGRSHADGHIKSLRETQARLNAAEQHHDQLAELARAHLAHEDQSGEVAKQIKDQNEAIAGSGRPDVEAGHFPEFDEPHLSVASPAGIEATTPGSLHLAADQHIGLTAGEHVSLAADGLFASLHKGIRLFTHKLGMRLIAGRNDISMEALQHAVRFAAALEINERAQRISFTATKQVTVNGGGSATIWNASGITEMTAGTHVVHAASKNFDGPASLPVTMPVSPNGLCIDCLLKAARAGLGVASP